MMRIQLASPCSMVFTRPSLNVPLPVPITFSPRASDFELRHLRQYSLNLGTTIGDQIKKALFRLSLFCPPSGRPQYSLNLLYPWNLPRVGFAFSVFLPAFPFLFLLRNIL